MSSPIKRNPTIYLDNLKMKQKLAKSWQKDSEQSAPSESDSAGSSSSKAFARKIPNLILKRKAAPEEASQGSEVSAHSATQNVSRSGRVRKAKGVFDPSDTDLPSKRKSASCLEGDSKAKKIAKTVEAKRDAREAPSDVDGVRRKTINLNENGCQVCTRSDPKKGRFVNCVDCSARGHFTCLRNAKLISMAAEENHWQCSHCLRCGACGESSKVVSSLEWKCSLRHVTMSLPLVGKSVQMHRLLQLVPLEMHEGQASVRHQVQVQVRQMQLGRRGH